MPTIQTHDFRVENARNYIESLYGDGENASYMFIAKPTPWENENRPPEPVNNLTSFFDVYHQMLSMKRILGKDCFHMIRRYTWQSGTTYDMYRHDYSVSNPSFTKATKLNDCIWYVINQNNDLYVCLDNNLNQPSIVEPRNQTFDPFFTSDGYQWMRLFTIESTVMFDYSTNAYIPITTDGANLDNYVRTEGEILTVVINNRGDNYTVNPGGVPNAVQEYYCKVVGDGEGAVASVRVIPPPVNNPEIGQGVGAVRIVRPGKGYSYATLDFTAGRVYTTLQDLDEDRNGLDPRGDGTFRSTVIINPPNGWGYDLPRQLFGYTVGVFSRFDYTLTDFFPDVEFRQLGILQNPETNVNVAEKADTLSGVFAFKVEEIEGQPDFILGETIYQQVFDAELGKTFTAKGIIVGYDEGESIMRYIQIPSEHVDNDGVLYQFQAGYFIHGLESKKVVETTYATGSITGLYFDNGFADTEVKRYSGMMTYLSNIPPIKREPTQTERIALLIHF